MHLAVPGEVSHLYHLQCALYQAGADRSWMSPEFHHEIADWRILADQTAAQPIHLTEIFRCEPAHLRLCDTSGLGAGGVWLDTSHLVQDLVWCHP